MKLTIMVKTGSLHWLVVNHLVFAFPTFRSAAPWFVVFFFIYSLHMSVREGCDVSHCIGIQQLQNPTNHIFMSLALCTGTGSYNCLNIIICSNTIIALHWKVSVHYIDCRLAQCRKGRNRSLTHRRSKLPAVRRKEDARRSKSRSST